MKLSFLYSFVISLIAWSAAAAFLSRETSSRLQPQLAQLRDPDADTSNAFSILCEANVLDPSTGRNCKAVDQSLFRGSNDVLGDLFGAAFGSSTKRKLLVVVMEQLGDFSSAEYAEQLVAVSRDLVKANISLRVIGVGDSQTAKRFADFTGLPLSRIRMDKEAALHKALGCHRGPNWDIPSWVPTAILDWFATQVGAKESGEDGKRQVARAWLNYMAMCAGIAAPGTLREILRGYIGDKTAPERLRDDEVVTAGPIFIKGVKDVKIGPIEYQSLWKNEAGYQRPAELATVRLRSMVEVLSNFDEYVPDQKLFDWRGATFLLDNDGTILYEYKDQGVLTYSSTMDRPLSFLSPYIGRARARNPLGLRDPED